MKGQADAPSAWRRSFRFRVPKGMKVLPSAGLVCLFATLYSLGLGFEPLRGRSETDPAPPEFELLNLGETFEFGEGHSITVSDYEEDVPFETDGGMGHFEGVATLFKAEICAGSATLELLASEGFFYLSRPVGSGHELRQAFPIDGVREPRFSKGLMPTMVDADTCHKGWVLIAAPDADRVHPGTTAVIYNNTKVGFVPEELELKLAWKVD